MLVIGGYLLPFKRIHNFTLQISLYENNQFFFLIIRQSEFLNELTILEAELTGINHWYIGLTDLGNKRSRKKGIFGLPGHEEGYVAWPRRGVCGLGWGGGRLNLQII